MERARGKMLKGRADANPEFAKMMADPDAMKEKTLEEISKIVTDINATLSTRKNRLAPQIKKLRSVRGDYQEVDSVYTYVNPKLAALWPAGVDWPGTRSKLFEAWTGGQGREARGPQFGPFWPESGQSDPGFGFPVSF